MTDLTFTINGNSYKNLVRTGSDNLQTTRKPVYGSKYTDLNKVDHYILSRYRGVLKVNLRAMSPQEARTLEAEWDDQPVTVTYYCFQTGTDVTQEMTVSDTTLSDAIKRSDGHWVQQSSVTFTEV